MRDNSEAAAHARIAKARDALATLRNGAVPLIQLEKIVREWVAAS
jgi:hypothetical protein